MRRPGVPKPLVPILILAALLTAAPAEARPVLHDDALTEAAPDPRAAAASWVAGRPVTVACHTIGAMFAAGQGDALAYVVLDGSDVVHLGPYVCEALRAPSSPLFGGGLLGLLHEAYHLAGEADESRANCRALRVVDEAARRFWGVQDVRPVLHAARSLFEKTPEDYRRC